MYKTYLGQTGAQIHVRSCGSGDTPLLCLPPAPHTGLFFETVMRALAYPVQAIDYPGYGGSDPLGEAASLTNSLAAYAQHLTDTLTEPRYHLFGFHTGNLVAAEMALLAPDRIDQIIMVDIPFFTPDVQKTYAAKLPKDSLPVPVEAGFSKAVTGRHGSISEARAFALWVESLRSGERSTEAFRGAFAYDCAGQFSKLDRPVHVIATQSGLLDPTRKAAECLPQAHLSERLDMQAPVMEANTQELADAIREILAT